MLPLLAVLALATLVLLPPPPVPLLDPYPHLYGVVENSAHPLIFALIAWLVLGVARPWCQRRHRPHIWAYLAALAVAFLLGATTETVQLFIARDGSLEDLVNDVLGAGFALCVHAWWTLSGGPRSRRTGALLVAGAAACAVLIVLPLAWAGAAYLHRYENLPRLWQRGSSLDAYFSHDNGASYPGLSLDEPWPDWRGYANLEVVVSNRSDAPVQVVLRVHDRQHTFRLEDRYNQSFDLLPQTQQTLSVPIAQIEDAPKGRRMDLRQIAGVILFRAAQDRDQEVDVEEIRLAR